MASPRPEFGMGVTAMVVTPFSSRARRAAKSPAAASTRSPDGLRSSTAAASCSPAGWAPPNRSTASPGAMRAGVEPDARPGGVVRGEHARRKRPVLAAGLLRRDLERTAKQALDGLSRHAAGTQQQRFVAKAGHDRRFQPDLGRSSVEDGIDPPVEIRQHVRGARGADAAGTVGGGRGDGPSRLPSRSCAMGWAGTRNATLSRPARGEIGHAAGVALVHHQRQRTRPECARERFAHSGPKRPCASADSISGRCAMRGLKLGRSLAA